MRFGRVQDGYAREHGVVPLSPLRYRPELEGTMRFTTFTFDFFNLIFCIGVVLLMVGVIPFTPVWVGALLLLSTCELTYEWRLR
jgi:hypothetical protein